MKYDGKMDRECVMLCDALNGFPGISTFESCCGHGEGPYCIWFQADKLASLPPVLYWFAFCHSGCPGWHVEAGTDCSMAPAYFLVEGPVGEQGYEDAQAIAGYITAYLKEEA